MMHRYYVGLQLTPGVSAFIAGVQQALFDPELMIAPLEPHITLLPPPAVEQIAPHNLLPGLKVAAEPYLPLTVSLTEVTTLNDAIVISVASDKLLHMREHFAALVPGHRSLHGTFIPHITLAQAQRGQTLPIKLVRAYREQLASLTPSSVIIPHITLFRWQRPREYTAEIV